MKPDLKLVYTSFKTTKYTVYTHQHSSVIKNCICNKWLEIRQVLTPPSSLFYFLILHRFSFFFCFPFVKRFAILLFSLCLYLPFQGFLLSFLKFLKSGLIVPLACEYIAIRQGLTLHRASCGPHTRPTVCD